MSFPRFVMAEDVPSTGTQSTKGIALAVASPVYQMEDQAGERRADRPDPATTEIEIRHDGKSPEERAREVASQERRPVAPVPMAPPGTRRPGVTDQVPPSKGVGEKPSGASDYQAAASYEAAPDVIPKSVTSLIEAQTAGSREGVALPLDLIHQVLAGMFGDGQAGRMVSRACRSAGIASDGAVELGSLRTIWREVTAKIPDRAKRKALDIEFVEAVKNATGG